VSPSYRAVSSSFLADPQLDDTPFSGARLPTLPFFENSTSARLLLPFPALQQLSHQVLFSRNHPNVPVLQPCFLTAVSRQAIPNCRIRRMRSQQVTVLACEPAFVTASPTAPRSAASIGSPAAVVARLAVGGSGVVTVRVRCPCLRGAGGGLSQEPILTAAHSQRNAFGRPKTRRSARVGKVEGLRG
jgi:hypothetical protein